MAILLAVAGAAGVLLLARRGWLHPGDYLVAAALAALLLAFTIVLTPNVEQHAALLSTHPPAAAVARSSYLLANGVRIELAALIFAVGATWAALLRRQSWH
ncbi:MAG: hypothetical protein AB7U83_16530 [Vicinamibacterales bacterium]